MHPIQKLRLQDSLLYVATANYGLSAALLSIIDVQQSNRPQILSQVEIPIITDAQTGSIDNVFVENTAAYVQLCTHTCSVVVFDITDPRQPQQQATFDILVEHPSHDFITEFISRIHDGLLYVAYTQRFPCCIISELDIFDVHDPTHIVRVGQVTPTLSNRLDVVNGLDVVGSTVYFGAGKKLMVVDVRDPSSPTVLNDATITVGALKVQDGLLYSTVLTSTQIFDVRDPTTITMTGQLETPDTITELRVLANRAYISTEASEVRIFDVSDVANPREMGIYRP